MTAIRRLSTRRAVFRLALRFLRKFGAALMVFTGCCRRLSALGLWASRRCTFTP